MSSETTRRIVSAVALTVAFAIVMGVSAVIESDSLKPFLLEKGFSQSGAALVVVFLYQAIAYLKNKIPSGKSLIAGGSRKNDILI